MEVRTPEPDAAPRTLDVVDRPTIGRQVPPEGHRLAADARAALDRLGVGPKGCAWALAGLLSWLPLFATTVKVWFVVGSVPVLTWMGDPTVQPPPLQTVPLAPEDEVHRTDE